MSARSEASKRMRRLKGSYSMHDFRFGMEEEYFVVDRRTGSIKSNLPQEFMRGAKKKLGPNLMYELLQSQIEVATDPMTVPGDARAQLRHFRATLAELGQTCNVGIVAAGSHPLALPHEQRVTRKKRYALGLSKTSVWLGSRIPFVVFMSMSKCPILTFGST
jgi:carboxylate-amine ligase